MDPAVIERLIDQGRDSYEARLAAGQARLKAGDLAEAVAHLKKATEHRPEQTMAWQELGRAFSDLGRPEAAGAAWKQGMEVARSNGDKQAEKVMAVFLRRLERQSGA
ncbi:MAG: tetratricopeptide repeat protein [Pseudomonadota bacterium]|nr:MAG: tetratricopeptide repeat protein [Pseudomonadota bacterium]